MHIYIYIYYHSLNKVKLLLKKFTDVNKAITCVNKAYIHTVTLPFKDLIICLWHNFKCTGMNWYVWFLFTIYVPLVCFMYKPLNGNSYIVDDLPVHMICSSFRYTLQNQNTIYATCICKYILRNPSHFFEDLCESTNSIENSTYSDNIYVLHT